jgi:Excalibur calcium-binding domain
MQIRRTRAAVVGLSVIAASLVGVAGPAEAVSWDNCDAVHRTYAHGVGRVHAHDHTSGTPVTSFKRSNRLYRVAMSHNRGLDGDGDKIACEAA